MYVSGFLDLFRLTSGDSAGPESKFCDDAIMIMAQLSMGSRQRRSMPREIGREHSIFMPSFTEGESQWAGQELGSLQHMSPSHVCCQRLSFLSDNLPGIIPCR